MILLNTSNLKKSFAGRTLFADLSFGIEEQEHIGLLGPNGAGKSTLLNILADRINPDAGTVSRKKGLRLGFVDQEPTFKTGATILEALVERVEGDEDYWSKALQIMSEIGLTERYSTDESVDTLSGGWKKRLAIARELVAEPELLFFDEPTNHLDVTSILWLEDYLQNCTFAYVLITHDRLFLQRTTNRILDLDSRYANFLIDSKGDYAKYLDSRRVEISTQQRLEKTRSNTLRRELEWLGHGSLARQKKQSARINKTLDLKENVAQLRNQNRAKEINIDFSGLENQPRKLIEAKGLGKSFAEKNIFQDLDLLVSFNTRLAILGENGSGKSTLIRVLLGQEPASQGVVQRADNIKIAYFEQARDRLEFNLSVLKNICPEGDYVHFQGKPIHVRSYLDRFLFTGSKPDLPVSRLSGGERARLRLAQLMLEDAHILVLDEPTNDLDSETLDVLAQALESFPGAVLIVTHDRYFMDLVSDQILAFPPANHGNKLEKFASYYQWENWFNGLQTESANQRLDADKAAKPAPQQKPAKLSYKDKFELENMESVIMKLEQQLVQVQKEAEDLSGKTDHKKLTECLKKLADLQEQIESKYQRWAELDKKV